MDQAMKRNNHMTATYRIAPNFQGTTFSWIGHFANFVEYVLEIEIFS